MRVFVPGGTGFLGKAVLRELKRFEHQVVSGGRSPDADIQFDITSLDSSGVAQLLSSIRPDLVVNLAGVGLGAADIEPSVMQSVNVDWPGALAHASLEPGGPQLIHVASSTELICDPVHGYESAYSESKAEGSAQVREIREADPSKVSVIVTHNTYGPTQPMPRLIRWLIEQALAGSDVSLAFPYRVRDFVYLDDAALAIAKSVEDPLWAHDREIGTGVGTSLADVARRISEATGGSIDLVRSSDCVSPDPFGTTVADPDRLLVPASMTLDEGLNMTIAAITGRNT